MKSVSSDKFQRGGIIGNGGYKIERELNRGGTAIVYAALDLRTGKRVALKVMTCPEVVPLVIVKREIKFSSETQHNNIVRLMDVFSEGKSKLILVWELVDGYDLLELLEERGGCMAEDMAAFYFIQLLRAVLFMHEKGFCHRDIKAENCMVERDSQKLKLIDFGLAKHIESAQTVGVGTPDYMAPEICQMIDPDINADKTPYGPQKVDAWAMGVVLYLLVSGEYPFEDPAHPQSFAHTFSNVLRGRMKSLPRTISSECKNIIEGLLKVQPEKRTTLMDLSRNKWLRQKALIYAKKVKRTYLVQEDDNQGQTVVEKLRSRSAPDNLNEVDMKVHVESRTSSSEMKPDGKVWTTLKGMFKVKGPVEK